MHASRTNRTNLLKVWLLAVVVAVGLVVVVLSQQQPSEAQDASSTGGSYTVTDLGSLGGVSSDGRTSFATGINNAGQVVGESYTSLDGHAFLYDASTSPKMQDLTPGRFSGPSHARGINDAGQVVGSSDTSSGGGHAFLYSEGQMVDLNSLIPPDSGWALTWASDINDKGQIVGRGYLNGQVGAFLLTPHKKRCTIRATGSPTSSPVPTRGTSFAASAARMS